MLNCLPIEIQSKIYDELHIVDRMQLKVAVKNDELVKRVDKPKEKQLKAIALITKQIRKNKRNAIIPVNQHNVGSIQRSLPLFNNLDQKERNGAWFSDFPFKIRDFVTSNANDITVKEFCNEIGHDPIIQKIAIKKEEELFVQGLETNDVEFLRNSIKSPMTNFDSYNFSNMFKLMSVEMFKFLSTFEHTKTLMIITKMNHNIVFDIANRCNEPLFRYLLQNRYTHEFELNKFFGRISIIAFNQYFKDFVTTIPEFYIPKPVVENLLETALCRLDYDDYQFYAKYAT